MAKRTSHSVISLVLSVVFVLLIVVFVYAVTRDGSFDFRSKAAVTGDMIQRWEFNGSTAEGWKAPGFTAVKVERGRLDARYGVSATNFPSCNDYQCQNRLYSRSSGLWMLTNCRNPADRDGDDQLCNAAGRVGLCGEKLFCCPGPKQKWTINMSACGGISGPSFAYSDPIALSVGNKYLVMNVGVLRETSAGRIPPFDMTVMYKIDGVSEMKRITLKGLADGKMREYAVAFPEIGAITVKSLAVSFPNLAAGSRVQADWIRFLRASPPTPTPTVSPTSVPTPTIPMSTATPAQFGKALQFANPTYNASYAVLARNNVTDVLNLSKEFTLEFWFKLNSLTAAKQHLVRTADGKLEIFTEKDGSGFTRVRVYVSGDAGWDLFGVTSSALQQGTWNHFALSYIPSYMGGSYFGYLNGSSVFKNYQSTGVPISIADTGAPIQISYSADSYPGIVDGAIDEFRVSDMAMYPYTSGPGTYTVPISALFVNANTRVLYHLDDALTDSAGNGSDLSVTNTTFIPH